MKTSIIILFIIAMSIGLLLCILYLIIIDRYSLDVKNRFDDYTVDSIKDNKLPFFEKVFNGFYNIIISISKKLNKSDVLKRYSKRLDKYSINRDNYKLRGIDYISIKFIISIIIGILYTLTTLIRNNFDYMILIFVMILCFFMFDIYLIIEYRNRRKQIENDLFNAIIIMNNAFKSGMNIMQAVSIVETELEGPIKEEFKKINIDIKYGLSLETVFDRFYKRVKIEDIKYLASSLSLINKTGGNIVKVFGSIEKNFYDKKKIKEEMKSLTSSSIFMFRLLISIPLVLIIIITMLNTTYFVPLLTTKLGRIFILLIVLLYILYIIVIRKVMKVDNDV